MIETARENIKTTNTSCPANLCKQIFMSTCDKQRLPIRTSSSVGVHAHSNLPGISFAHSTRSFTFNIKSTSLRRLVPLQQPYVFPDQQSHVGILQNFRIQLECAHLYPCRFAHDCRCSGCFSGSTCTASHVRNPLPENGTYLFYPSTITANAVCYTAVSGQIFFPDATFDYCNIAFACGHAGKDDKVLQEYWPPSSGKFRNRC